MYLCSFLFWHLSRGPGHLETRRWAVKWHLPWLNGLYQKTYHVPFAFSFWLISSLSESANVCVVILCGFQVCVWLLSNSGWVCQCECHGHDMIWLLSTWWYHMAFVVVRIRQKPSWHFGSCLFLTLAITHCNALQHTATHCSTQHTATHCTRIGVMKGDYHVLALV